MAARAHALKRRRRAMGGVRCSEPSRLVIHGAEPKATPGHPLAGVGSPVTVGTPAPTHVSTDLSMQYAGFVYTVGPMCNTGERASESRSEIADLVRRVSDAALVRTYARAEAHGWPVAL